MSIRTALLATVVLAAALTAELSLASRLPLAGATPDLVLLFVVAFGLAFGSRAGLITGFAGGLALDLVPPADSPVGRWAFALCVVGYLAGAAAGAGPRSLLTTVLVVALSSGVGLALYALLGFLTDDDRVSWQSLARVAPRALLWDVILGPLVFPVARALPKRSPASTRAVRPLLSVIKR